MVPKIGAVYKIDYREKDVPAIYHWSGMSEFTGKTQGIPGIKKESLYGFIVEDSLCFFPEESIIEQIGSVDESLDRAVLRLEELLSEAQEIVAAIKKLK